MKDNFHKSLDIVLEHEGGYVDHPKDPGGRTNMGITQKVYEKYLGRDVTEEEMKNMSINDVRVIYRENYWDKVQGDSLPMGVDFSTFDWAVNSGVSRSSKAIQQIVKVTEDGVIGPVTIKKILEHDPNDIIMSFADIRADFYKSLSTFDTFGKGWLNRNSKTRQISLTMANIENIL
tara:strand:+ start:1622 stop:2149 length:528 start_codon:yes stop_codon:yes gene_type:complete